MTVLLVGLMSLSTSCRKKDRVCTCTYDSGNTPTVYTYGSVTEDEANEMCQNSLAAGIGGNCSVD